jgi:effector-binding domain-containing protein
VAEVSDTYLIKDIADCTLMVARYKFSPESVAETINDIAESKKLNNMVLVMNACENVKIY